MQERREIVLLSWHHHPNLSDMAKTTFLVLFTKPTLQILPACAKATAQPWSNFCPVKGALGRCFSAPRSWIWGVWGAGGMEDEAGSPFRFCWGVVTVKTSAGVTSRAFSEVRQVLKSLGFSHNWQGIFFCRIQIPSCLGAGNCFMPSKCQGCIPSFPPRNGSALRAYVARTNSVHNVPQKKCETSNCRDFCPCCSQ